MTEADYLDNSKLKQFFKENRKCIVNTDLDGLISGMILQHFLNWEIVGYSSCSGRNNDNLWLKNENEKLEDCVFVDLPVCIKDIPVIDQHFITFDDEMLKEQKSLSNKLNPNIANDRVFKNEEGQVKYSEKYPFGTVHFLIALLEKTGIIKDYEFDFTKSLGDFDLADLILRADRVIGNTNGYKSNCLNWCNWLISLGGNNTKTLFEIVKGEYLKRKLTEIKVEEYLISNFKTTKDGDCSKFFSKNSQEDIDKYFRYLSERLGMAQISLTDLYPYNKLDGTRFSFYRENSENIKDRCYDNNIFSYAIITTQLLSATYIEK